MASTFPLEVVTAARWVEDPAHKSLSGDALVKALEAEPWDPSVKSLVPFPVVLATMNSNLTWLQQLGYAFATQQADVFAAVQRLRRLAQANDKLQSSPQQVVSTQQVTVEPPAGSSQPPTQQEVIVIQPAQSDTVYVPSYNPAAVYGSSWPYPSYPPYYAAPPPGYYFGTALATGLAFAAGAAVVGGLWGWASPGWGGGYANVNVNRYNNINANRSQITSNRWGGGAGSWAGRQFRARARRTGRALLAVRKSPYRAMRCGLRPARGRGGVGRRPGGRRRRRAVSAARVARVVPVAWAVSAAQVGRAVPGALVESAEGPVVPGRAWAVSAVAGGRRRVGGRRRRGRWSGGAGRSAGRPSWRRSAAVSVVPVRPAQRPAGGGQRASWRAASGRRVWRHEQRTPSWAIRAAGRAEPIVRSAAIGRRRWARRRLLWRCSRWRRARWRRWWWRRWWRRTWRRGRR